jgi:integrase
MLPQRMPKPLTDLQIRALKPPAKRVELPFGDGLFLLHSPTGAKSWALRYRRFDKPQKLTLGRYMSPTDMLPDAAAAEPRVGGVLSLTGARLLVQRARRALEQGVDPAALLQGTSAKSKPREVEAAFKEFVRLHVLPHNRASSAKEAVRLFDKKVKPHWKGRSLDSIRRRDVLDLLGHVRDDGAPVTANRVLALVRKFFNWCVEQEFLETSPANNVRQPTAETSRDRFLSDDEISLVWRASGGILPPFRQLIRLLILTGQRRGEVASMLWSEISADQLLWSLPKAKTKNGRAHIVPLSEAAQSEILSLPKLAGSPDYVFTTGAKGGGDLLSPVSGFSKVKARLDELVLAQLRLDLEANGLDPKEAKPLPPWRLHDLRRTVATGMQKMKVDLRVIEKVINHISGSSSGIVAVYQVYDYEEERREALDKWAAHVLAVSDASGTGLFQSLASAQAHGS